MASWKKVIMEDSAAALSSLTLTTALAVAQGGTGATTAAGARSALSLGSAATTNASAYATAAQGKKQMPKCQRRVEHLLEQLQQTQQLMVLI